MTDTKAVDPLGKIPRFVIFRGRRARVLGYDKGKFEILAAGDEKFLVSRDRVTFLPNKKIST